MNFNILEYTNFKLNNSTNEKNMSEKPKLVDNGVKYFFKEILKGCHNYKQNNYNYCSTCYFKSNEKLHNCCSTCNKPKPENTYKYCYFAILKKNI